MMILRASAGNTGASLNNGVNGFVQLLTLIIVFILVLALTYWTTKFVAGYQKTTGLAANFENIDTYRVNNTKYIQILRVGKKYLVIAVCKDSITTLAELNEDEFEKLDSGEKDSFGKILDKLKDVKDNIYADRKNSLDKNVEGKDNNDKEA